jgi:hypothetical protein
MTRLLVVLLPALPLLTMAAAAQEPRKDSPPPPSAAPSPFEKGGGPPGITVVDGVRDGALKVRTTMTTCVPETYTVQRTVPTTVDGKTVYKQATMQETRLKAVHQVRIDSHALSDVRVFDSEGRPVAPERIPAIFNAPRMVLVTMSGMPVDPAYLQLVRPGTHLVVLPMPLATPMPAPTPAPGPADAPKAAGPAPTVAPAVAP